MRNYLMVIVEYLELGAELIAALFVGVGCIISLIKYVNCVVRGEEENFIKVRFVLACYLALALEFQLAADILATIIAPTWETIGKLGAIAVIRTALNYFLSKEIDKAKMELYED